MTYGICSRVCKEAVLRARADNVKAGLINLISLYPFPKKAFANLSKVRKVVAVELTVLEQMTCDVKAVLNEMYGKGISVLKLGKMSVVPTVEELLDEVY